MAREWYRVLSVNTPVTFPAEFKEAVRQVAETVWEWPPSDVPHTSVHHFTWREQPNAPTDEEFIAIMRVWPDQPPVAACFPVGDCHLDGGGMMKQGSPLSSLDWNGLAVTIPCGHVPSLLTVLKSMLVAGPHRDHFVRYEIGAFHQVLLVLEDDLRSLIVAIESLEADARARDDAFWNAHERPESVLRRVQGLPDDFDFGGEG